MMRKFKNVTKQKQTELECQFPNLLSLISRKPSSDYLFFAVSFFDHWLNEEEAMKYLHMPSRDEIVRRCDAFDNFNNLLFERSEIYTFRFKGRRKSKPTFKRFTSVNSQSQVIRQTAMGEYKLVLPALDLVYFEGYDDTNTIFFRSLRSKSFVEHCAKSAGLHCLEQT